MWPYPEILELLGIEIPLIQAPMAGSTDAVIAASVSATGALGSLPCAMMSADRVHQEVQVIRSITSNPFNLNFFCHQPASQDRDRQRAWLNTLAEYYDEFNLAAGQAAVSSRTPFDTSMCDVVEDLCPSVVSFHFGLPSSDLLRRVKAVGCKVIGCATTVREACWLEARGVDAVIAQGYEAGGHRGMFLTKTTDNQVGTFALVPQVVDSVSIPVIAAGGVADGRGMVASFALGASAVQLGSVYLMCPEAKTGVLHRTAISAVADDSTSLTNVFTGRPARGVTNRLVREIGPMNDHSPEFPIAAADVAPLRAVAEAKGSSDFSPLWAGQAASFARDIPAADLTRSIAREARQLFRDQFEED